MSKKLEHLCPLLTFKNGYSPIMSLYEYDDNIWLKVRLIKPHHYLFFIPDSDALARFYFNIDNLNQIIISSNKCTVFLEVNNRFMNLQSKDLGCCKVFFGDKRINEFDLKMKDLFVENSLMYIPFLRAILN